MNKSFQLLGTLACAALFSASLWAGQQGGGMQRGMEGAGGADGQQRREAEEEVRSRVEPGMGSASGQMEQDRERVETEMEQRTREAPDGATGSPSREQTRTTEEMQQETGQGAGKVEPGRETTRRWWEFWK